MAVAFRDKRRLGIDWLSRAAQSCGGVHATRHRVEDTTLWAVRAERWTSP
jgi:hypothetical protein